LEYSADVDVILTAPDRTSPIPLPASALLRLGALEALGAMRRKLRAV